MRGQTSLRATNQLARLLNRLRGQGVPKPSVQAQPQAPLRPIDSSTFSPRVLLINIDPIVDSSARQTLSSRRRWNRVDTLIDGYISDLKECSRGILQYRVMERRQLDEFPHQGRRLHLCGSELPGRARWPRPPPHARLGGLSAHCRELQPV